jgi:hypothetical protein
MALSPAPFRQRAGLISLPRAGVNSSAPPRGYVHPATFYWRQLLLDAVAFLNFGFYHTK